VLTEEGGSPWGVQLTGVRGHFSQVRAVWEQLWEGDRGVGIGSKESIVCCGFPSTKAKSSFAGRKLADTKGNVRKVNATSYPPDDGEYSSII
jgi:hypothetical protein